MLVCLSIWLTFFTVRTRRLLKGGKSSTERKTGAAFVATMVAAIPNVKEEIVEDSDKGSLVLTTTAEFCRNIGEEAVVDDTDNAKQITGSKDDMIDGGQLDDEKIVSILWFISGF